MELHRHNRGIATSSAEPRGFCGVFEQLAVSFVILADAQMASEPNCEQPGCCFTQFGLGPIPMGPIAKSNNGEASGICLCHCP